MSQSAGRPRLDRWRLGGYSGPVNSEPERALARAGSVLRSFVPLLRGALGGAASTVDDWMSSILGEEFNARLHRVPLALGSGGVDPFGLDPVWTKWALAATAVLHRRYFRTEVFGADKLPKGRLLLISNHSGQIPIDAALIGGAMFMDTEPPRFIRAMVEKWTQTLPFISLLFSRVGQVVGVPENALRLLEQGEVLLVFPEGARGISKTFDRRYQLTDFGLGFMRLAIETGTPIVPVAVIGGEEQYISVKNLDALARLLRMPSFPLMPQVLLPGGVLPLPTKYRIYFGEPMHFDGDPDDDDAVIEEKVWLVRATVQSMVNRGVKAREHIFW
jgi:1-acyl-sn-glycerol-3-phosphate acyltransferase